MTATQIHIQNTRLFPKSFGAGAYNLTGIAARCDWVIMTDTNSEKVFTHGNLLKQPSIVFLSMRAPFVGLLYFFREILPRINQKFVLITASEDVTLPNQIDARWRSFNHDEKEIIKNILNDKRVIHWFAENVDETHVKMTSLPLGYVFEHKESELIEVPALSSRLKDRALKVLCSHRVRIGKQWDARRHVTRLCEQDLSEYSTVITEEISYANYLQQVRRHPFILCVQGGGIDPSPKAWMAIVNGTIPIIKSSPLDDSYSQLPAVIVEDWNSNCITKDKLRHWIQALEPFYEDTNLRAETLNRLSLDYWWEQILASFHNEYPITMKEQRRPFAVR
ncbi:hypothetical protein [Paraglaciecola sp. MB-3u-78]|uniref:hypothetical protein n=1 Tax=Paraglaciecola sp. MB-3u-78 TaxID=2058332 RepID=UPI000C31BE87|nr:hypothetical protein [Paraglaciecola sp. MB-3u-78]PKG95620.1 hypothetical protein CXF95_25795 [Paraglaciecola sp. MB-3u-78]